jgi:tyrosyl-tRNA synthetase
VAEGNGVIAFAEHVLMPAGKLRGKPEFIVKRERDGLEPLAYSDAAKLKEDYTNDVLTPQLLKAAVSDALVDLMAPIQEAFQASKEWQEIALKAYPPPEKKVKKEKKLGTRYPGGAKAEVPVRPKEGEAVEESK